MPLIKRLLVLLALPLLLGACASTKLADYQDATPELVLEEYFKGRTVAFGVFEDRFGKLRREFKVIVDGTVEDDGTLVLDEDFYYKDGERDRRVWRITRQADGTYIGRADDIIGTATGRVSGNILNWQYKLDLEVGDGDSWRVAFDDWLYLQENGVLINRATITRWGFEIGTITITFVRPEVSEAFN